MQASINSIESCGTVDGPGIRTVIFFNKCLLRCKYCHNPECFNMQGLNYTCDDLIEKIKRYKPYYGETGGVTLSGGEPLLQAEFVISFIKKLKKEKINIALSVTITNEFLNFQEDMLNMFENIGVQNINYNLLHSHDKIEGLDLYYNNATEFIISSYERLYKKGIMDDRILRKINAFVNDIFYYADCGAAYANQIVLKPDGTIGICQGECSTNNHEIGNIIFDDFSVVCNNKNRLKWKYKLPIYNEYCLDC